MKGYINSILFNLDVRQELKVDIQLRYPRSAFCLGNIGPGRVFSQGESRAWFWWDIFPGASRLWNPCFGQCW